MASAGKIMNKTVLSAFLVLSAAGLTAYILFVFFGPVAVVREPRRAAQTQEDQLNRIERSLELPAFNEKDFGAPGISGEETVAGPPAPAETEEFVLMGVSLGNKRLAMLRDRQNRWFYCTQGQKLGDYTVKQIERRRVVLEKGSSTVEVTP